MIGAWRTFGLALAWIALAASALPAAGPEPAADTERWWSLGVEGKLHFRDSEDVRFISPFPFPEDFVPAGQDAVFLETPDPGSAFEISQLTLYLTASWSERLEAHAKVDFIDLYDRNPTSGDQKIDVDELWIRFGRELLPARPAEGWGGYLKVGKFGKFERQDDRHLESYGLVATAFNRFEDTGVELGLDCGRFLYLKASYTQGNPVFFRDPDALAGDNGTEGHRSRPPETRLGSGIPILYDAEVEDTGLGDEPELGAGLGVRFGSPAGSFALDFLLWGYRRDLADHVSLEGTFYGGDLDLLEGPSPGHSLPIDGREKREVGANLWLYAGGFGFFGQVVDQEIAGMARVGFESELVWRFELPLRWAVGGHQLFPSLAPAVRYSRLDPDFEGGDPTYPAPSVRWEWEKLDLGVRIGVVAGLDLTVEYAANTLVVAGHDEGYDELLATLRFRR